MGNYTGGVTTVCPYYSHESDKTITCEGVITDTCVLTRFLDVDAKVDWQVKVCSTYKYGNCPIAHVNNKKYGINGGEVIIPVKTLKPEAQVPAEKKPIIGNQIPGQIDISEILGGLKCRK